MELQNPTITITNTTGGHWQVRLQQQMHPLESIDIALLLPRCTDSLPQLQRRLLDLAIERLTTMRDSSNS